MTFLSGKSRNKKFKIIQKKYLSLFVLGIFFVYNLILVWPNNAQAANCAFSCNDSSKTSAEYCASLYVGGRVGTTFSIDGPPDCDISKASCGLYSAPVCCCVPEDSIIVLNTPTPVSNAPKFNAPELQIQIPGLVFDEADVSCVNIEGGNYSCSINWIAKYVASIYNYGLTVGGILAALMLMAGGLLWLTSGGDSGKVSKAKGFIGGSITGLIILFSAYMILYEVNPELTALKPITIGQIKDGAIGDSNIPVNPATFTDGKSLFLNITGINCGIDSYPEMMKKAKGKVIYSQAKRMTAAPNNKIYMDCSSFANLITVCAGKSPVPDYTETLFTNQSRFNGDINSLKAGDLIGWKKSDASVSKNGHVYIYLGNKRFGDANGSSGIGNYSLSQVLQATERHTGQSIMPYVRRP